MHLPCIPADRANIDHSVTEYYESSAREEVSAKFRKTYGLEMTLPFDRNVHVCDVMEDEIHERLVLLLADPFDERLRLKLFSELVSNKAVLGEGVVKIVDDCINLAPKIRIH